MTRNGRSQAGAIMGQHSHTKESQRQHFKIAPTLKVPKRSFDGCLISRGVGHSKAH